MVVGGPFFLTPTLPLLLLEISHSALSVFCLSAQNLAEISTNLHPPLHFFLSFFLGFHPILHHTPGMAIDDNFGGNEFRPLHPNRNPITYPETPFPLLPSSTSITVNHTSRMVKMLCSYGGRIIPRPGDGALRYAGGHTRIISVNRRSSFPEFYRKMAAVYGGGGPVAIRYKIPDEEIDVLVSVSSSEDLENMMCEYDKLGNVSGDGSARFRIFLFSPLEIAVAKSEIYTSGLKDDYDIGKMYIEAINGVVTGEEEDGIASDGLTDNGKSLITDHFPRASADLSHDPSRLSFIGNAASETEFQKVLTLNLTSNPSPAEPYSSQGFVDMQQAQCITPCSLPRNQMVNAGIVPQLINLSPIHISSPSVPTYLENLNQSQGSVKSFVDENQDGERILQFTPNGNCMDFCMALCYLPPLYHSNAEHSGMLPLPPPIELHQFRLEHCQIPQMPLHHAHSDTVVKEQFNIYGVFASESCPTFPTHHSDDKTALQSPKEEVKVDLWESMIKPKLASIVNLDQFGGSLTNQNSVDILKKENFVDPNANKFDHSKSKLSLNLMGLSGDNEEIHESFINFSPFYHEEKLHRQQQELHGKNFNVNKNCYLPTTMDFSSPSVPSYLENLNQNQGTVKPSVDENQDGERILKFTPNGNCMDFPLTLSHLPPVHHSNMQLQNVEHSGMLPLPPLLEMHSFRLEDCQIPQKPLHHAHSDTVIMEQSNISGVSASESCPTFPTHHSEDTTALHSPNREVKVDLWESVIKPKLVSIVNLDQFGDSLTNQNSVDISKEDSVVPKANKFDHSKSKLSLNLTGLSGGNEELHESFIDFSSLYHEKKLHRQQQELHGKNFNVNKYCYLPTTMEFSNAYHNIYGVPPSPPQPFPDNSSQQKTEHPAELFDHAMFFRRPGIYSPPVMSMKSSGAFFNTSQFNHEKSPQHMQSKQFLPGTIKEDVIRKQLGEISSSVENREYQAQPSMCNFVQETFHDYVKPADGMMETHVLDFEKTRLNEKINPGVANHTVSKDMKTEISPLVGEQNHGKRPQNEANMFIGNNVFACPGIVPERVSVGANNPMVSNTGFTKVMNPEISSMVGEGRSTMRSHNCADILLSRNAFLNSGMLPEHAINATLTPESVLNHDQQSHIFERKVEHSVLHDVRPGIAINKSPDEELKDKAPLVHPKDLNNETAAFERGSVPFPFSKSSFIPRHMQQLIMRRCTSDSFFCCQDPWGTCPQRSSILGGDESVSKDVFYENFLSNSKCPDMAILLEEGALQPPVGSLNNNSPPTPFQTSQGSVNPTQDIGELAKQVGESVLKSLTKYPPVSCSPASNESSSTFSNWFGSGEGMTSSSSVAVPLADGIERLQLIKNIDLQELQELGSGTYGTVFYGKWRGSEVAIKRINTRCFTGKPSEQERMRTDFWNEASKLADLHHPNVLAFYGIVLDGSDGSFATVTEYMVNGSLRNALQCNENTFDRRKRILIATDVAFGMEYLHGKNIVHFDLKSDNLLVNLRDPQRPICKVGDLGLSKVKCKTLISGGVRGTLPWMAPELLNGSSNLVSEKVDVFSFGIVMWELLTGQEPYADLHCGAIIGGIVNNTLRPPVPESCDPDWKALMERCWSAEPSARPSFTQIAHNLSFMMAALPSLN